MKIFIFNYNFKNAIYVLLLCFINNIVVGQTDSLKITRTKQDTTQLSLNMDAVYNRPFLKYGKIPIAIGGYAEANTEYKVTDGITDGFAFQMRRMTLFLSSSVHRKIKFLSELEFEGGTKEINIEFAGLDIQLHHLVNLRGGIIMNPIGSFNQNHDGPKWEFIDRPISATQLLPATFSNVGFGLFGKTYKPNFVWSYEIYLTNGFNDQIIGNTENKTFLPATKLDPNRFEESFNGEPLTTAKTSIRVKRIGELGVSYMGGVYNKFEVDGIKLDKKRRADVFAVDFNTVLPKIQTTINSEFVWTLVDVPETYTQQYGKKQHGGFIDVVQPVFKKSFWGFEHTSLNLVIRAEYVDWNVGVFNETGKNIADDVFAIVPGVSLRLSTQTVVRFNYRYEWRHDLLGNPSIRTAALQFGISSYF